MFGSPNLVIVLTPRHYSDFTVSSSEDYELIITASTHFAYLHERMRYYGLRLRVPTFSQAIDHACLSLLLATVVSVVYRYEWYSMIFPQTQE